MAEAPPFSQDFEPDYGRLVEAGPGLRRLVARNPGPFTFTGTGTYVIGRGQVAVVDPGPDMAEHIATLLRALSGETITHILITHTHSDHSGAADTLKQATGAQTYGFGPHGVTLAGMGEGADLAFKPDIPVDDGDEIGSFMGVGRVIACHTPGHASNHLCFLLEAQHALLSGDHVMGWASTVVVPPDGSMADYIDQLARVRALDPTRLYPTHGAPVDAPRPLLAALIEHRRAREAQILAQIRAGQTKIGPIVAALYGDVPQTLHAAAAQTVFAHLIALVERGKIATDRTPRLSGEFWLR